VGADKTHPDTRPGVSLAASTELPETARSQDSAVGGAAGLRGRGALQRLVWGQSPDTFETPGVDLIPAQPVPSEKGLAQSLARERHSTKHLEKPHTRVAGVPQGTPGVPQKPQRRTGREASP